MTGKQLFWWPVLTCLAVLLMASLLSLFVYLLTGQEWETDKAFIFGGVSVTAVLVARVLWVSLKSKE